MRLEDLTPGNALIGLEPAAVATVVAVVPIAEGAVQVIYKTPDGTLKDRLLGRGRRSHASPSPRTERPWSFDGDGDAFKLAVEAKRIDLAFLFDPMMAVHTSNVEPLPHQITAVYESMLPRQPLRFVLADDPGAGKTIMAGLYIRELIMRADARRILIVAPGSLVEQWRDELFEKFGLEFRVFSIALEAATPSGNPFEDHRPAHRPARPDVAQRGAAGEALRRRRGTWSCSTRPTSSPPTSSARSSRRPAASSFAEKLGARHPAPAADDRHAAQRQGGGLPALPLAARLRPLLRQVPRRRPQGRCLRPHAPHGEGGAGQVRRHAALPRAQAYTVNYKLSDLEAALYEAVTTT